MNPFQQKAIQYSSLGYSVMPVGKDKRPVLKSWKYLQKERASDEQLELWFKKKDTNIGIITGEISGITVIDVDSYQKNHTPYDKFPETYTVKTGNGGFQLYYQHQEGLTISANAYPNLPGIDIRGNGGYVVAPPSVTSYEKDGKQSGGAYEVIKDIPLAPFPIHLFPKHKAKPREIVGVPIHSRNDSLFTLIRTILSSKKEEVWYSEVLPAVEKINETYKPPLPLEEVHTTFNSVVNYERNKRLVQSDGVANEEEKEIRQTFVKNKTQGTYDLAKYMVKKFDIITIGEKEREMFVYREGMYFQAENEIIYPEIQRILGHLVTKNAKNETFHKIADMTAHSRDIFSSASLHFIPLVNGVYDRETKQLLPHDAKYRFTYQLPVKYEPEALCPRTLEFFKQILDEEQQKIVEEWLGYYFHRNYMFKKAIILVGEGDTGKTTFLEVVNYLLGRKNISGVSLQKMTGDKFAAAHMFEKHGNLVDELSAKDINDTGNFKIATGGGSISGEYKFGNQFSFNNFSKLTFACNKIPDVKDFDDEAYFNRWMVVRFNKVIENKVPDFIKTLATEEERSGMFNLAMIGLDRLLAQGKFSYGKTAMDTKRDMMKSGSSIAVFVAEMLIQQKSAEISKEDLYDAYSNFCAERNLAAETPKMLGTKLMFYVSYMSEGHITVAGKRVRGWRNVALTKQEEENELEF